MLAVIVVKAPVEAELVPIGVPSIFPPLISTFDITTEPVPFGVIIILELLLEVLISKTLADAIFIPPALAVIWSELLLVPVDDNIKCESVSPSKDIVRSCPSELDVKVRFESEPIASKLIPPPLVQSTFKPPVPKLISNEVLPVVFPIVIVFAAAPVPIFIGWDALSLPILIAPELEFISITPSASRSIVLSESIIILPVPLDDKFTWPVPDVIFTAVAPVELPIFNISANSPVPIFIVLSPWVPIFIFWSISSLPILIAPALELSCIAALQSKLICDIFVVVKFRSVSKTNISLLSSFIVKPELVFKIIFSPDVIVKLLLSVAIFSAPSPNCNSLFTGITTAPVEDKLILPPEDIVISAPSEEIWKLLKSVPEPSLSELIKCNLWICNFS